ncbi:hypothetical protein [Massilia sp. TSP1-1-2]|uniref:hypothetical protein n=1 Tax=Massilia sp. TSP1-1-2 TaxID=2804649 RepID=UPI003CF3F8D8
MPIPSFAYRVESVVSGQAQVLIAGENRFSFEGDDVLVELASITTVGVKHLSEVDSHTVNSILGSRSHVVRFINGSVLRYAYNSAGDLLELSGENLACTLSAEGELLFRLR